MKLATRHKISECGVESATSKGMEKYIQISAYISTPEPVTELEHGQGEQATGTESQNGSAVEDQSEILKLMLSAHDRDPANQDTETLDPRSQTKPRRNGLLPLDNLEPLAPVQIGYIPFFDSHPDFNKPLKTILPGPTEDCITLSFNKAQCKSIPCASQSRENQNGEEIVDCETAAELPTDFVYPESPKKASIRATEFIQEIDIAPEPQDANGILPRHPEPSSSGYIRGIAGRKPNDVCNVLEDTGEADIEVPSTMSAGADMPDLFLEACEEGVVQSGCPSGDNEAYFDHTGREPETCNPESKNVEHISIMAYASLKSGNKCVSDGYEDVPQVLEFFPTVSYSSEEIEEGTIYTPPLAMISTAEGSHGSHRYLEYSPQCVSGAGAGPDALGEISGNGSGTLKGNLTSAGNGNGNVCNEITVVKERGSMSENPFDYDISNPHLQDQEDDIPTEEWIQNLVDDVDSIIQSTAHDSASGKVHDDYEHQTDILCDAKSADGSELHNGRKYSIPLDEEQESSSSVPEPDTPPPLICEICSITSSDAFMRSDDRVRCHRCHTYKISTYLERPKDVSEVEPDRVKKKCANCKTKQCRQWRRDLEGRQICSECCNYFRRKGVSRPKEIIRKYRMQKDLEKRALSKPRVTRRFKPHERKCANCGQRAGRIWRAGKNGCCLCGPCWSYWYRRKEDRPSTFWTTDTAGKEKQGQ